MEWIKGAEKDFVIDANKYPKLKALQERVVNQPKIKEWIKKRPQTAYWKYVNADSLQWILFNIHQIGSPTLSNAIFGCSFANCIDSYTIP